MLPSRLSLKHLQGDTRNELSTKQPSTSSLHRQPKTKSKTVRGEKPLESGSPLFSGLHNFHVIFSEVQISGSDAHSEEGNRRRKDDDEIRHVNNFPFSRSVISLSFFFLFLFFLDRAAISLGINLVRKFQGKKRVRPWTLTPTATFLHPALALATTDTTRQARKTCAATHRLSLSPSTTCAATRASCPSARSGTLTP